MRIRSWTASSKTLHWSNSERNIFRQVFTNERSYRVNHTPTTREKCMGRAVHSACSPPWEATWVHRQMLPPLLFPTGDWVSVLKVVSGIPRPYTRHLWQQLRYAKVLWKPPLTHPLLIGLGVAFKFLPWLSSPIPSAFEACMCLAFYVANPCFTSPWLADLTFWLDPHTCLAATGFSSSPWDVVNLNYCCGTCSAFLKCLRTVWLASEPSWPSTSAPGLSSAEEQLNSGCSLPPSQ